MGGKLHQLHQQTTQSETTNSGIKHCISTPHQYELSSPDCELTELNYYNTLSLVVNIPCDD